MKNTIVILASLTLLISSCDKVDNAYPNTSSTIDWSLYPGGDSTTYTNNGFWPAFSTNTNTLRNVMVEDYTGHQCPNCPIAADSLHAQELQFPGRVFGTAVHAGPTGLTGFQLTDTVYVETFYNTTSLEIGSFFGSQSGTGFFGNPRMTVNRILTGTDNTTNYILMKPMITSALNSTLKVNIQSVVNYFPATRGVFLHTEVDILDNSLTNLGIVVYVVEDSLVAPQKTNQSGYVDGKIPNYIHRDILRGTIDNSAFGRTLTNTYLNANGNYYVNYSYALPSSLEADNTHLLIYVYDKSTYEIYQVIKEPIN